MSCPSSSCLTPRIEIDLDDDAGNTRYNIYISGLWSDAPRITTTTPWQIPTAYSNKLFKLKKKEFHFLHKSENIPSFKLCLTHILFPVRPYRAAISWSLNKSLNSLSNFQGQISFDNHGEVSESHEYCRDPKSSKDQNVWPAPISE